MGVLLLEEVGKLTSFALASFFTLAAVGLLGFSSFVDEDQAASEGC